MENELLKIKEEALAKLADCSSLKELNEIRVLYLGKKGPIQEAMKSMKDMAPAGRWSAVRELQTRHRRPDSSGRAHRQGRGPHHHHDSAFVFSR